MVASALLRNTVSIKELIAATPLVKQRNTVLYKKMFPAIKHSNVQGKIFFRNNFFGSQLFLMSCYFTKIFVHLSVITAVGCFSVC